MPTTQSDLANISTQHCEHDIDYLNYLLIDAPDEVYDKHYALGGNSGFSIINDLNNIVSVIPERNLRHDYHTFLKLAQNLHNDAVFSLATTTRSVIDYVNPPEDLWDITQERPVEDFDGTADQAIAVMYQLWVDSYTGDTPFNLADPTWRENMGIDPLEFPHLIRRDYQDIFDTLLNTSDEDVIMMLNNILLNTNDLSTIPAD